MIILPVLVLHALLGLYDCHGVGHDNESPNGWSRDLKEDMIGHAGLPGTQHGKDPDHDEYFTTNSGVPMFPSITGFMGTHGAYRHLTVHEQTAVLIGDGKHGLFRIQESGFIRRYLKKDMEGIPNAPGENKFDLNALDLNNMDQKKQFDLLKDNYCNNEYHYPDEKYSDNDYLNYVDLTIYHPIFEDKYKSHVQIDLPHYFSTLPGPENTHAHNVFEYAAAQPQANKIGPLGKRAGLDIKELYHDVIRFHFLGDAGVYANIGQGNDATDKVFKTLQELRDRAQTLSYKRIDLSKVDHEIYLFERPFQGRNHLYITIIFDNDQDYTYLRKDGEYFDKVVAGGVNADPYPAKPNYFPLFPIENEASKKKVYGTSVYGHHQSARHEHGHNGGACPSKGGDFARYPFGNPGASWPTTLEEITPMCDAILLDIKMYYDLDKSWDDASLQLGNAGFYPAQVTNYTVDLNKFGYYTDPYLQGRENPVAVDLTPDGKLIMNSDDAKPLEIIRLDFGTPSQHLDYVESEGLKLDDIEHIQGDQTMMENLRGHAGAEGTQHGKKEDHPQFYETNSGVPILPSVSGFMATHGTHRHLSVHEQTIVMIGEPKHGVWRIQENGMVRLYRKKGMVGVSNGTNPNALDASNSEDKLKLDILKKNYAAYVAEEGFYHYKYPDEEVSDEGYLNFVDLTIYHPQFEGKYDNHTVIDLPHFLCTMPQPYFPHAHNVWKYATKQKRANKLGPLAIRAGMDVKENYPNAVRFDFFGDAGLYVNVGTGNPETDYVQKTLDELRNRTQTLNFMKADLSKMNFEMYLFERPFYGMPYIFVNIVLDYGDNLRYLRPDGPYYEEVKKRGLHNNVPEVEDHFPTVAVEGSPDKKVIGLAVYGHHHPARTEHGLPGGACPGRGGDFGRYPWGNNGAMWPNNYQEISPVCDGFLLDVKGVYDLDKPWKSDNLFLGNAGYEGAQTINYTVDTNIYGKYEDEYLKDHVNEHMMDLTPDNQHVNNTNNTHEIEHMRLDFGVAGDYLEFIEAKDLRPDVPKETIKQPLPSHKTMDEGDNVELRFVVPDEKDLYSCCSDDLNSCTKQSCDHEPGLPDCHFVANVRRDRGFCGHHLTYRTVDLHVYHDIEFHFNFRPQAPKVKHAKYDTENNCLVIQLEPEDTGHCNLTYSFKYHCAENRAEHGQIVGTQHTLQGIELKSCFKMRMYDEDYKPYVTIMATNTVGNKQFGEETKMHVEEFKPEEHEHEECPKKDENEKNGNN